MSRILFRFRRTLAVPAAFGATLALATLTYPGGVAAAYGDLKDYDTHREQLESTRATNSQLDVNLMNLMDRLALKEQWLDELISGRATLKVTTRRFVELNRSSETAKEVISHQFAGATDEEKAARNVIAFVQARLHTASTPSNTPQRLQNEFREMFGTTVNLD